MNGTRCLSQLKCLSAFRSCSSSADTPIHTTACGFGSRRASRTSCCVFLGWSTSMFLTIFSSCQDSFPFDWRFEFCWRHGGLVWFSSGIIVKLALRILTFSLERCWSLKPTAHRIHVMSRTQKRCRMHISAVRFTTEPTSPEPKSRSSQLAPTH